MPNGNAQKPEGIGKGKGKEGQGKGTALQSQGLLPGGAAVVRSEEPTGNGPSDVLGDESQAFDAEEEYQDMYSYDWNDEEQRDQATLQEWLQSQEEVRC